MYQKTKNKAMYVHLNVSREKVFTIAFCIKLGVVVLQFTAKTNLGMQFSVFYNFSTIYFHFLYA